MKSAPFFAVAAALSLCMAQGSATAQTATPDIADKLQLCTGCHGEGGLPVNPDMPIIWGQNYYYLYVQLKDYAAGRRQNEVMTPIASELSKEEQQALAKHFSEQPWPRTEFPAVEPPVKQQAQRAMTAGACTECHLSNLQGRSGIPRVAGQQPAYLEKTMLELKNKVRQNAPAKSSLFATFPDEDLKALAAYLATR
jgi:cytochrome c553